MPARISRRRLVAHAAWSVPAVVVASAAPAFAASASCPVLLNRQVFRAPGGASVVINFDPRSVTKGVAYSVLITVIGCNAAPATQVVAIAENQARFSLTGTSGCTSQVLYTISPPGGSCADSFTVPFS